MVFKVKSDMRFVKVDISLKNLAKHGVSVVMQFKYEMRSKK